MSTGVACILLKYDESHISELPRGGGARISSAFAALIANLVQL